MKINKVLVIGIKGMAGHIIFKFLQADKSLIVYGIARNIEMADNIFDCDVSNTTFLNKLIQEYQFDYIINCIGILNITAENNPQNAIWYNSYFPYLLHEFTNNTKTRLIHLSTDCVFNGKTGNYDVNDVKNGEGVYAQTKALGEIINNKVLTIRTSIIGPELNFEGIGLFNWFMNQKNCVISGFKNMIWSGVTTLELARFINFVIKNNVVGLIHLTNGIPMSKFDLLNLFAEVWNREDIKIKPYKGKNINKSLKKSQNLNYQVPSYREMLNDQFIWMNNNKNLYHY